MRLWTRKEVSELTGFSLSTIDRAIRTFALASLRVRHSRRIPHNELIKWLGYDILQPGDSITVSTRAERNVITRRVRIQRAEHPTLPFDIKNDSN